MWSWFCVLVLPAVIFGLKLQIFVSSSGQILKQSHVCERECNLAEFFFFVLNRFFGTMFFLISVAVMFRKMH